MLPSCATGIIPVNHSPVPPFSWRARAAHHLEMDQKKALGAAIKALRKEKDLTQEEIESACGIGQSTLSKIESGTTGLSFQKFNALAKALRMLPSEVMARAEHIAGEAPKVRTEESGAPAKADPLIQLGNDIDALRYVLGGLVGAIARHERDIASDAALGARAAAPKSFHSYGVMKKLLDMLEQQQDHSAAAPAAKRRVESGR